MPSRTKTKKRTRPRRQARKPRQLGGTRKQGQPIPSGTRTGTRTGTRHTALLLKHLGSGKYSDVFRVVPGQGLVMKVSYYRDSTMCDIVRRIKAADVTGAMKAKQGDAIQVGHAFSRLTASLVDSVSPHFVVEYCEHDCSNFAPRLGPILKERLATLSPLQRQFNNVCFMELFQDNLTRFLVKAAYDERTLCSVVFQMLYTVAALQRKFPGFRHNDLSTNNVLIKKLRKAPRMAYTVTARTTTTEAHNNGMNGGGTPPALTFHVTIPYLVAMSDYDFVHVPTSAHMKNERVLSGKYKVDGRANDSYDSHFFLKSVLKCIQRRISQFPRTVDFLRRLRLRTEDRQNATVMPRLRPERLLRDAYFAPLLAPSPAPAPDASYAM